MKPFPTLFGCEPGGSGTVLVLGAPYDRGTDPERAGCAAAPGLLRSLSGPDHLQAQKNGLFELSRGRALFGPTVLSDLGNVRFTVNRGDEAFLESIAEAAATIASSGKKSLVLGGDHLVTLPVLRGLARGGRVCQVVQLDAHHDFDYTPAEPGERPTHATFISTVASEALVRQVLQIGVRGLSWTIPQPPSGVRAVALAELGGALLPGVDVYLTVDTDGFDPSVAPGVSFPEPCGLAYQALPAAIAQIRAAGLRIVGADWTEYNPKFDTANHITGRFVLNGLAELIGAMVD